MVLALQLQVCLSVSGLASVIALSVCVCAGLVRFPGVLSVCLCGLLELSTRAVQHVHTLGGHVPCPAFAASTMFSSSGRPTVLAVAACVRSWLERRQQMHIYILGSTS